MYKNNAQTISKAAEKMKNNLLLIEDILDEEDLVNDLKSPSFSQLISFLTTEKMEKLLDYILQEPPKDCDKKYGHKFPYYACEILCSENVFLLEKYFEDGNKTERGEEHSVDHNDESFERNKKSPSKEQADKSPGKSPGKTNESDVKEEKSSPRDVTPKEEEKESKEVEEVKDINDEQTTEVKNVEPVNDVETSKKLEGEKEDICEVLDNEGEGSNRKRTVSVDLKNEKKAKFALIDYLFKFLDTNEPLNYVLSGYFTKVFNHLSNQRNSCFMNYLFENKELIFFMLNHLNRRSISEALYKILISNNVQIQDTEIKTEIYNKILDIFDGTDIEQSQNICDLLTDSLSYKKNYNLIIKNPELFKKFHTTTVDNIKYDFAVKDLLKVLIKLYENILKDISSNPNSQIHLNFNDQDFPNDIQSMMFEEENNDKNANTESDIKSHLYVFAIIGDALNSISLDFAVKVQNPKEKKSHNKSLGVKRYSEIEYFRSVFELIVYGIASCLDLDVYLHELIKIIVNTNVFTAMIDNFFEYEWNNLYQKVFEQIFHLIVYKTTPSDLIENVLIKCRYPEICIDQLVKEKFAYHSGRNINSGTFAAVCEFANILNESDNEIIRKILDEDKTWQLFLEKLLRPLRSKITANLLYNKEDSNVKNLYEELNDLSINESLVKTIKNYENPNGVNDKVSIIASNVTITTIEKEELTEYYDNNYFKSTSFIVDFDPTEIS